MAEPSYFPLSPLEYPLEGTTASPSPEQSFRDDSDSPHPADTAVADPPGSHSSVFLAPLRPQLFQKCPPTGRSPLWRVVRAPLKISLFPLVAIGYLAFCYTVHDKVVPVNTYGLYAVTPQHLSRCRISSVSCFTRETFYSESYSYYQRWYHFYQYHHHIDSAVPGL